MKTKISTHKVQEKIWKLLVMSRKIPKHFDSGHLWDISKEMIENPNHQSWKHTNKQDIINIICTL